MKNPDSERAVKKKLAPCRRKLWYDYLRTHAAKFQRDRKIGGVTADFYCESAKIAIVLYDAESYDDGRGESVAIRASVLESAGATVVRICDEDVERNFPGVCAYIDEFVEKTAESGEAAT